MRGCGGEGETKPLNKEIGEIGEGSFHFLNREVGEIGEGLLLFTFHFFGSRP
jgi:hypothetical protein